MITDLNQKIDGEAPKQSEYVALPKGNYPVVVKEIKPWVSTTKDIYVNEKDENGYTKKDGKGNKISNLVKDCIFYQAKTTFEVTSGEFKGRRITENLTTHPNADFIVKNFLFAAGIDNITVGEIPTKCVGVEMELELDVETYDKKTTKKNPETGIETVSTETKETNRIKNFLKLTDLGL